LESPLLVCARNVECGYTGLCQAEDVRAAKPLKDELGNRWESWMIEEEAAQDGELPRRE